MTTDATELPVRGRARRAAVLGAVLLAVALAALWPLGWAHANHGSEALLGAGTHGPSSALISKEVPDAPRFGSLGHDGQQFYAVARHPFDPAASRDQLDSPAYRYRRILLPALAGLVAPNGGRALVFALLGVSLAGVALGAWAVSRFPGGPAWLPLVVGITPGVGVALALSLGDALATGLALAAIAGALRRRWAWMTLALVAAALTRETLVLVAFGLLWTPGMPTRWKAASIAAPLGVAGTWAVWSAHALGTPMLGGSGQIGLPLVGWLQSTGSPQGQLLGLLTMVVLAVGAWHTYRTDPGLSVVLGLHAVLMMCLADDVTTSWLNTTRVAAPVFAVAVWAIVRQPAEAKAGADAGAAVSPLVGARPTTLVPS